MAFNLDTVSEYIKDARTLLLDKVFPYRYTDDSLLAAFNLAIQEGRRLRPDLFVYKSSVRLPVYTEVDGTIVPIEPSFRRAFAYGIVGHALLRDQDDVQDVRGNNFLAQMEYLLTGQIGRPQISGGTPNTKQPAGGLQS